MTASLPRIALQLYTLRELAAKDLEGTLGRVAELGYEGVQLAGLQGHDASTVRGWLEAVGLEAASAHIPLERLEAEPDAVQAEVEELGIDRLVAPWLPPPSTRAEARAAAARLEAAAGVVQGWGRSLGYHNHDFELRALDDGGSFWGLLASTAPDTLFLELDLGWLWYGGADPRAELRRAGRRCPQVHVKDYAEPRGEGGDRPVGDGVVGYDDWLLSETAALGVRWLIVEQDHPSGDGLGDVARSMAHLRALRDGP